MATYKFVKKGTGKPTGKILKMTRKVNSAFKTKPVNPYNKYRKYRA